MKYKIAGVAAVLGVFAFIFGCIAQVAATDFPQPQDARDRTFTFAIIVGGLTLYFMALTVLSESWIGRTASLCLALIFGAACAYLCSLL